MKGFNRFSSFALVVICLVLLQHHGLQFFLNEFSGKATSEDAILKAAVQEAAKITDKAKEDARTIRQTALAKAQAEIKQMTARALATLPKTGRWPQFVLVYVEPCKDSCNIGARRPGSNYPSGSYTKGTG
jgi:hypothetical protein